jgi:hypothetical protein
LPVNGGVLPDIRLEARIFRLRQQLTNGTQQAGLDANRE